MPRQRVNQANRANSANRAILPIALLAVLFAQSARGQQRGTLDIDPAWSGADAKPAMTADQTRAFIRRVAQFVFEHHLKQQADSPQRGLVYEYLDMTRLGQFDQFVQGEALDTMHDGAWFAGAMVNAYRATGDGYYKRLLTQWQLPFYLKMLNHSDALFTNKGASARAGAGPWDKPWAFQEGEKGFVPYWWDDGNSVSLERRIDRNALAIRPSHDEFVARHQDNPRFLLHGYSLGMSNHMAQDLGVMVELAWLLLKDSAEPGDRKLADELAAAAGNLHENRQRHFGAIPMCVAPAALAGRDAALMRRVPDPNAPTLWNPSNHTTRALVDFKPGQRQSFPGFADDQEFTYYYSLARSGGKLTQPLAFHLIYDAFTQPMLYDAYCDDVPRPAGLNRFDLFPFNAVDGSLEDYRSDRKGHFGKPRPSGSRFGPQNMVVCGWALQALRRYPGIWEKRYNERFKADVRVYIAPDRAAAPGAPALNEPAVVTIGPAALRITCTHRAITLAGTCRGHGVVIRLLSRPNAKGDHAVLTITKDATAAVNQDGAALKLTGDVKATNAGLAFNVTIPFTIAKGQKRWANAIEHGRMSIAVGQHVVNLYLASREADVKAWLEHELAGGLRTWEAVFDHFGYIPTGMGTGRYWDHYSDSGAYAHLVSAASQWLLYLDGKSDWQVHNVPAQ